MKMKVDNRRDFLLLLLYSPGVGDAPNEPLSGRTRLIKALFLFREEVLEHFKASTSITSATFYEFFPWNFGPFSRQVYDDLNFFQLHGFIQVDSTEEETLPESAAEWVEWLRSSQPDSGEQVFTEYEDQRFQLSVPKGLTFAAGLYETLSQEQRRTLREFKARIVRAPLRALLRYVYERYPSQIENSEIREQVLGDH